MTTRPLLLLAGAVLASSCIVRAEEAPQPAAPAEGRIEQGNRFIRYTEDENRGLLQTSVTRYVNADGVSVDLVGAVHLADPGYYEGLNKLFKNYEVVLYEMVGDDDALAGDEPKADDKAGEEKPKAGKPKPAPDPTAAMLRGVQGMVTNILKLQHQVEGIDYKARNFVHADVSWEQFRKMQAERGETFLTLIQRSMKSQLDLEKQKEKDGKAEADQGDKDDLATLMTIVASLQSGDPSGLKLVMARQFEHAEQAIGAFEGEKGSVIIAERNKVVMEKLAAQVKDGRKKVAVFYGAGHYTDMERRLLELGFHQTNQEWRTAWDITKPKKAEPAKKKAA